MFDSTHCAIWINSLLWIFHSVCVAFVSQFFWDHFYMKNKNKKCSDDKQTGNAWNELNTHIFVAWIFIWSGVTLCIIKHSTRVNTLFRNLFILVWRKFITSHCLIFTTEWLHSFKMNPIKIANSSMQRQIKSANIFDGEDTETNRLYITRFGLLWS